MLSYSTKNTIHQVTTMLATSKNILFPDHNHLWPVNHQYWWPDILIIARAPASYKHTFYIRMPRLHTYAPLIGEKSLWNSL